MRRKPTDQDRAHSLLQTWGSSIYSASTEGIGYPPAPIEPTVQGSTPEHTHPEKYTNLLLRHVLLDSAWRSLRDESRELASCLWRCYVEGKMESQARLREAREAYLRQYEALERSRAHAAGSGSETD